MSFEALSDFKFHSKVSEETIEKYKDSIPPELLEYGGNMGTVRLQMDI